MMKELLWEYIVEHAKEVGLFAFDLTLLGITTHLYNTNKKDKQYIQESKQQGINNTYKYNESGNNRTYGIVNGTVKRIGQPLNSLYDHTATGVVHKLTLIEHVRSRSRMGFWHDYKKILNESYNYLPFYIKNDKYQVTVHEPLLADRIDLSITHDKYDSVNSSLLDAFIDIFSGNRQRGIQTTEEMLRLGCAINAVGDIVVDKDGSLSIIQPEGKPFYIIRESIDSLLNNLESNKQFYKTLSMIFGVVGAILLYYGTKGFIKKYKIKKEKQEKERRLLETRQKRRAAVRDRNVVEELQCVVCHNNPREIVIMPCGHFCICEDCSSQIQSNCPMCQSEITDRIPTYL